MVKLSREVEEYRKKLGNRPTKLSQDVLLKIEQAAAVDASITEICLYAEISRETFYTWMERHPWLAERIKELREKPALKARETVVRGLDSSPDFALRYLERKKADEFGPKTKVEHSGSIRTGAADEAHPEDDQARAEIKERLRDNMRKRVIGRARERGDV